MTGYVCRIVAGLLAVCAAYASSPQGAKPVPTRVVQAIHREVRYELITLPFYGVFDNLQFKVTGRTVTLLGQVTRATLKTEAERAVKAIEGVEAVDDQIEVLPLSANDDRIRLAAFRAIYDNEVLQRYAFLTVSPIRIIVKNGNVVLDGTVDSVADRNLIGSLTRRIPGVFSVTNGLKVEP